MGGFLGIGGSSAKTDRGVELGGFQDLKDAFGFGMDQAKAGAATGTATTNAGVNSLSDSLSYWKKLVDGSRASMMQAIAPETTVVQAQADAAKRNIAASGTARGGGTAGAVQQVNDATQSKVDEALFGVRPEAAQQEASVGGKIADIGTRETGLANQAFGIGTTAAESLTGNARMSRTDSYAINKQTQQDIVNAIQGALAGMGGGGGGAG